MANIPIWPGSSSFCPGDTPFGYYDNDYFFQQDVDKIADWCAKKLGYPILEVELQDINLYACIEEAITEFSTQVNMYNAKDYMLTLVGTPTGSTLNNKVISPNMGRTVNLAQNYGTEVGSGGNVDWKKGYIDMIPGSQSYDLNVLWTNVSESGNTIEVKRVYHDFSPAISRYFDPYVGTGAGTQQLLDGFGWGSYSPAVNFLVMPLYADLLRIQAIEMNDQIRKSSYTFELRNNKINLFPIPSVPMKMWFEYLVVEDRNNPVKNTSTGNITDLSNVPYDFMTYEYISPIGKQWIYKYALGLAKELLGLVRNKYSTVPIPGAEVTLNGADLIAQGREDKANLLTELKELLQAMTRQGQLEQEQAIATAMNYQLSKVPLSIYIK